MPRRKKVVDISTEASQKPPVTTIEDREDEMVALAVQLAERRLREGTATSQEIVHFLKLGSTKAKLEREKLIQENKLLEAKTDSIRQSREMMELYERAMEAMKSYSGKS